MDDDPTPTTCLGFFPSSPSLAHRSVRSPPLPPPHDRLTTHSDASDAKERIEKVQQACHFLCEEAKETRGSPWQVDVVPCCDLGKRERARACVCGQCDLCVCLLRYVRAQGCGTCYEYQDTGPSRMSVLVRTEETRGWKQVGPRGSGGTDQPSGGRGSSKGACCRRISSLQHDTGAGDGGSETVRVEYV